MVLGLAYFTELIGFSSVFGAFVAGMAVSRIPFSENKSFSDKIKSISFGLFVPLFFVWFGLEINIMEIFKHIFLAVIIFISYVLLRFAIMYYFMKRDKLEMAAITSISILSVDVESLVVILVAIKLGIFTDDSPLTLFAPSVFFSTLLIVALITFLSRKKT